MKNIERKELVNAVLASRDKVAPELETQLLEAIVDAEADSVADGDAAMRAIDVALTDAINRGVGYGDEPDTLETIPDGHDSDGEDHKRGTRC